MNELRACLRLMNVYEFSRKRESNIFSSLASGKVKCYMFPLCLMARVLSLAIYFPPPFVILNRALLLYVYNVFMLYRLSTWL